MEIRVSACKNCSHPPELHQICPTSFSTPETLAPSDPARQIWRSAVQITATSPQPASCLVRAPQGPAAAAPCPWSSSVLLPAAPRRRQAAVLRPAAINGRRSSASPSSSAAAPNPLAGDLLPTPRPDPLPPGPSPLSPRRRWPWPRSIQGRSRRVPVLCASWAGCQRAPTPSRPRPSLRAPRPGPVGRRDEDERLARSSELGRRAPKAQSPRVDPPAGPACPAAQRPNSPAPLLRPWASSSLFLAHQSDGPRPTCVSFFCDPADTLGDDASLRSTTPSEPAFPTGILHRRQVR